MPDFTCITEVCNRFHLSQHQADGAEQALRTHIGSLPFDDGAGPLDDELDWLQQVLGGKQAIELLPVHGCMNTWMWADGARREPKYITYIVRTEVD